MLVWGIIFWIITGGIISVIIVWLFFNHFSKHSQQREQFLYSYLEGLNNLIAGEHEKAIDCFKDAAHRNSDFLDTYVKLGFLYRQKGEPKRAATIHRELLARPNLSQIEKITILRNLVYDYFALEDYDKALTYTKKILELDKKDTWAVERQIQICEQKEEWGEAFSAALNLQDDKSQRKDLRPVCYKMEEGMAFYKKGDQKEARICFKDAIKLVPSFPPPYILIGDSYLEEGHLPDALGIWKKFISVSPKYADLVFQRLEKALFEEGKFEEIEGVYRTILSKNPEHEETLINLGEFYYRKGEPDRAVDMLNRVIEKNPSSIRARKRLVEYLDTTDNTEEIKEHIEQLLSHLKDERENLCTNCGTAVKEFVWRCPKCKGWATFPFE